IIPASAASCLLSLVFFKEIMARALKTILIFNLTYLITSLVIQTLLLGFTEPLQTALSTLKLLSLSLSSLSIATVIYPTLIRRACSHWFLLSLLIAMKSVVESYASLSDTLEAVRVNYGKPGGRWSFHSLLTVAKNLPLLVLDSVLRKFEYALTALPASSCRVE
ncbi:MAG: hypothetical protein N3E43_06965, partial [Sulfolobales archaeon]|nr:hypothetical protein [Sulfolobales archaeon]